MECLRVPHALATWGKVVHSPVVAFSLGDGFGLDNLEVIHFAEVTVRALPNMKQLHRINVNTEVNTAAVQSCHARHLFTQDSYCNTRILHSILI